MSLPLSSSFSVDDVSLSLRTHRIYALATLLGVSVSHLHTFLHRQSGAASAPEQALGAAQPTVTVDILLAALVQVVVWPYVAVHKARHAASLAQSVCSHNAVSLPRSQISFTTDVQCPQTSLLSSSLRCTQTLMDDLQPQTAITVLPFSWPPRRRRAASPDLHCETNENDKYVTTRETTTSMHKLPLPVPPVPPLRSIDTMPLSSAQAARLAQPCIERFYAHAQRQTSTSTVWAPHAIPEALLQSYISETWRLLPPMLHSAAGMRRIDALCPDFVPRLLFALLDILGNELGQRTPGEDVACRPFAVSPSSASLASTEPIRQSPIGASRASSTAPSMQVADQLFCSPPRRGEEGQETTQIHHDNIALVNLPVCAHVVHRALVYLLVRYAAAHIHVGHTLGYRLRTVHAIAGRRYTPVDKTGNGAAHEEQLRCKPELQSCLTIRSANATVGAALAGPLDAWRDVHDMALRLLCTTRPCLATIQLCAMFLVAGVVPSTVALLPGVSEKLTMREGAGCATDKVVVRGHGTRGCQLPTLRDPMCRLGDDRVGRTAAIDVAAVSPHRASSPSPPPDTPSRPGYVCAIAVQLRHLAHTRGVATAAATSGDTRALALAFLYVTHHLLKVRDKSNATWPSASSTNAGHSDACSRQPQPLVTSCRQLQNLLSSSSASSCTRQDVLLVTCCVLTLPTPSCVSDRLVVFMAQWLLQALAALLAPPAHASRTMTVATTMPPPPPPPDTPSTEYTCRRAVCAACVGLTALLSSNAALLLHDLTVPFAPLSSDAAMERASHTLVVPPRPNSAVSEPDPAAQKGAGAAWSRSGAEPPLHSSAAAATTMTTVSDAAGGWTDVVVCLAAHVVSAEAVRLALMCRLARAQPARAERAKNMFPVGPEVAASSTRRSLQAPSDALYMLYCAIRLLRRAMDAHPVGLLFCENTQRSVAAAMATVAVLLLLLSDQPAAGACEGSAGDGGVAASVLAPCFQILCGILDQMLHDYVAGCPRTLCACLDEFGRRNVALLCNPACDSYTTVTSVWQALRQSNLWELYAAELETIEAASHLFVETDDVETSPPPTNSLLGYIPCAASPLEAETRPADIIFGRQHDVAAALDWTQEALHDMTTEWWSAEACVAAL